MPHIDVARVRHSDSLKSALSPGVRVDVAPSGNLQAENAYGNHPGSESHTTVIRAKIVQDIMNGRALAFKRSSVFDIRGLRVSPLGTVESKKLRIIQDLTFAGDGYRSSANNDILVSPLLRRVSLVTLSGKFVNGSYTPASTMAWLPASCCTVSMSKTRSARFP